MDNCDYHRQSNSPQLPGRTSSACSSHHLRRSGWHSNLVAPMLPRKSYTTDYFSVSRRFRQHVPSAEVQSLTPESVIGQFRCDDQGRRIVHPKSPLRYWSTPECGKQWSFYRKGYSHQLKVELPLREILCSWWRLRIRPGRRISDLWQAG